MTMRGNGVTGIPDVTAKRGCHLVAINGVMTIGNDYRSSPYRGVSGCVARGVACGGVINVSLLIVTTYVFYSFMPSS